MKYYAIFVGQLLTLACASEQTSKDEPSGSLPGMDVGADAAVPALQADASSSAGGAAMGSDGGPEDPDAGVGGSSTDGGSTDGSSTDGGSTDGGSTDGGSTDGGSTDGGLTDGGSTGGSGSGPDPVTPLALGGPVTLAPGGVALLQLSPDALMGLSSLSLGGLEIPLDAGERVQFVLVRPENVSSVDFSAVDGLKLTHDSLGAVPEGFHDWLRVTVRVPTDVPAGETEFELLTAGGDRYVWPVQMIEHIGPYVPPSPDGIIWPAVRSRGGVFPVGTEGPFYAIADPLFGPSYPAPMNPPEVKYDLRLRKPGHSLCSSAAPLQGEIIGSEHIDLVDENGAPISVANPIFGTYDWESNFVELTINRSAMGGSPELYRGGWVEGDFDSIPEPSERGQLAPPTSDNTLIALHAVRTGLPLTITHVSGTKAFEQACAVPAP